MYDYFVNAKTGKFHPWAEVVQEVQYTGAQSMSSVFVPTAETSSLRFFLDLMVDLHKPIMFVGGVCLCVATFLADCLTQAHMCIRRSCIPGGVTMYSLLSLSGILPRGPAVSQGPCCCAAAGAGVGKTQLVKGKLASLPEDIASLSISFNYFTDVASFQKVGAATPGTCEHPACWQALQHQ